MSVASSVSVRWPLAGCERGERLHLRICVRACELARIYRRLPTCFVGVMKFGLARWNSPNPSTSYTLWGRSKSIYTKPLKLTEQAEKTMRLGMLHSANSRPSDSSILKRYFSLRHRWGFSRNHNTFFPSNKCNSITASLFLFSSVVHHNRRTLSLIEPALLSPRDWGNVFLRRQFARVHSNTYFCTVEFIAQIAFESGEYTWRKPTTAMTLGTSMISSPVQPVS